MIVVVFIIPIAILAGSLALGAFFGERFPARWWLFRLGLVPALGLGLAGYVMMFPSELPPNYDPYVHGNPGRLDFFAIMGWGAVVPLAYLAIALPVMLAYAIWKRTR